MKKSADRFVGIALAINALIILVGTLIFMSAIKSAIKPASAPSFNTSALNEWCGDAKGEIRMVGAWASDANMVEDETGELWNVNVPLSNDDFYLLWIDDMGTSEVEDDEIIKVWSEAHD